MPNNVWLQEAQEKLKDAQAALHSDRYSAACFWAQQAAELALKAVFLERYSKTPPKVHDLLVLARNVDAPKNIFDAGAILNPSYTESRYVDVTGKAPSKFYTMRDAQRAVENASEVLKWCISQMK